jgi:hypothetical protein
VRRLRPRSIRAVFAPIVAAVVVAAVVVAVLVLGRGGLAGAATKGPGLLAKSDLPSGFLSVVPATTVPDPTVLVTDAATCSQTLQPVTGSVGGWLIQFTPGGAPNALPSVTELVIGYHSAAAARASYAKRSASHTARLKCGTVALRTDASSAPTASVTYHSAKFRAVGRGHFAEQSETSGTTTPYTSVTFLSGTYVVGLTFSDGSQAMSRGATETLAARAAHRLKSPVFGP